MRHVSVPRLRSAVLFGLLLPFLQGCSGCDTGAVTSSAGRIVFEPDPADFGYVIVGQQKELKVGVTNAGRGALKIRSIDRADGFPAEVRFSPPRMDLGPGEQQFVTLLFLPTDVGLREGKLLFHNDGTDETVELVVKGTGFRPNLAFEPSPVDFGPVILDETGERTASLKNLGEAPLDLFVDGLSGPDAASFRVVLPGQEQTKVTIGAGEKVDLALNFTPRVIGARTASFAVRACAGCDATSLPLTGQGIAAGIIPIPNELDFGAVLPKSLATKTLTLKNVGTRRIAVTDIAPARTGSEFAVIAPSAWPDLQPGEESTVDFTYAPNGVGADSLKFIVTTDDTRSPRFELLAKGYGGGPVIDVAPAVVEFNQVAIGFPVKRRVVVVNKGLSDPDPAFTGDDLIVTAVDLPVGTEFERVVAGGMSFPLRIEPGKKAVLEVTYSPTDVGEDASTLTLRSNDAVTPALDVPVHGQGAFPTGCDYQVLPAQNPGLQFGVVQRGRTTRLPFTIRNVGASDCIVGSIEVDPATKAFLLPSGGVFGQRVAPGGTLVTEVEFAPPGDATSGTDFTGAVELNIASARPADPLGLSGRAAEVCLSITPAGVDFGVVKPVCETNDRNFTIYNACTGDVAVQSIETGAGTSEFRVIKPTLPATLKPQQQLRFSARYRPTDLGRDNGTVEVKTNQSVLGGLPYVITLTGSGDNDAKVAESFVQADNPRADILFVVDDSGSMEDWQEKLAENFAAFMTFAQQQAIDYRIAVTTTGTLVGCSGSDESNGRFSPWGATSAPRIVDPTLADPAAVFASNVAVGTNGCSTEMGLEGAYLALSDPNINGANADFLRNDAALSIIIISDAPDQSLRATDFYVDFFQNIKGPRGANMVSVSAIVWDDVACPANSWEDAPTEVYREVTRRTGGVFDVLCTDNWSVSLQKLGQSAFGYKTRFVLTSEPDAATLVVKVDGQEIAPGTYWTFSAETNSIDFLPTAVPPAGAHIDVAYAVACH